MDLIRRSRRKSTPPGTEAQGAKEVHSFNLPPYDRTIDAVCHRRKHDDPGLDQLQAFSASLGAFIRETGREKPVDGYWCLPDNVRFEICRLLISTEVSTKPVTLSRQFAIKDTWPAGSLIPLRNILSSLTPYLDVSWPFRADIMVTLFSTTSFHTTFSPFVNTRLSPLATTWFLKYAPFMSSIVLEVDLTKLSFGNAPHAGSLDPALTRMEELLKRFGKEMREKKSDDDAPLGELILLCRRYYGDREPKPQKPPTPPPERRVLKKKKSRASLTKVDSATSYEDDDTQSRRSSRKTSLSVTSIRTMTPDPGAAAAAAAAMEEFEEVEEVLGPYCPDECLDICNHLLQLRGLVDSARLCGFSETFTKNFLATLFRENKGRFAYRMAPSGAWPQLKGQQSFIDTGGGNMMLLQHDGQSIVEGTYMRPIVPPPPAAGSDGPYLPGQDTMISKHTSNTSVPKASEIASQAASVETKKKRFGTIINRRRGTARV